MREIAGLPGVSECLLVETCNRVEIYAVVSGGGPPATLGDIEAFWRLRKGVVDKRLGGLVEKSCGLDSLLHLLRVGSGLESMVVGEDQILGQIREAYKEGREAGTIGPVLDRAVRYALQVGKSVRTSTRIDRGSVSVGSVAVELMEESLDDLRDKRILIIGAGEAGEAVGRALALRRAGLVFVANRTFSRALEMAEGLGATAIRFHSLESFLASADAVVVATSAPHFMLTLPLMARVMKQRPEKGLVVADLSEPRNADPALARLPGLTLLDLDDLHSVSRASMEMRRREMREAERIVQRALGQLSMMMKRARAEPLVSALCRKAERIREEEVRKAMVRLRALAPRSGPAEAGGFDEIVEDFSKSLVEALLYDPITNLRRSSAADEFESVLTAGRILGLRPDGDGTRTAKARPPESEERRMY